MFHLMCFMEPAAEVALSLGCPTTCTPTPVLTQLAPTTQVCHAAFETLFSVSIHLHPPVPSAYMCNVFYVF